MNISSWWRVPTQPWEAAGISRRGSIARYVGAFAISLVVWLTVAEYQSTAPFYVIALDLILGVVAFALVSQRRKHPMTVALATVVLSAFSSVAAGPATLASVSVATRRHVPQVVIVGLANVVTATVFARYMQVEEVHRLVDLSVNVAFAGAMMAWGMYIGSRRELLHNLKERAERAEAEQELRSGKARGDERARIAREMHDVLAHRISQVSMLAGALSYRTDLTADEMRESSSVIQEQANHALDELRAVLGVLRDPHSGDLMDRPQPTWADVPALAAEAWSGGMHVVVTDTVEDRDQMPTTTGRTAYRMVQEAVTNARKHAPAATVQVEASGGPEAGLSLMVSNPLGFREAAAPGAGLGLIGLAERAALCGGTLSHGREGTSFVVRAWLPWGP